MQGQKRRQTSTNGAGLGLSRLTEIAFPRDNSLADPAPAYLPCPPNLMATRLRRINGRGKKNNKKIKSSQNRVCLRYTAMIAWEGAGEMRGTNDELGHGGSSLSL